MKDALTESERLAAELAELEKEGAELDGEDGLTPKERELRMQIRGVKLENIAKRAAKKHGKVWPVDLDPKGTLPATLLFQGQQCVLHTQFVVRGAESKEWNDYSADIRAIDDEDPKRVSKVEAITRTLVIKCLVFPSNGERSHAEHSLDLAASFDKFPLIEKTLSDEIARLGGMILADKRKSVG
jgi:hypothetical protein